jgi:hypothetical protein
MRRGFRGVFVFGRNDQALRLNRAGQKQKWRAKRGTLRCFWTTDKLVITAGSPSGVSKKPDEQSSGFFIL